MAPRWWKHIGMEPAICLYMFTSFLKYPVFQNLLYEKACLQRYHQNETLCTNLTAIYKDKVLQADENHLYFLSSLTLTIPSLVSALILGSLSDSWSSKGPMLFPLVGLILGDATHSGYSPYWLLLSDAIFGACGGYTAIIGTMLAYGVKTTAPSGRSYRMAAMEGAIGLGGTFGYAISGTVREAFGYAYAFLFMMFFRVLAFLYVVVFAHDFVTEPVPSNEEDSMFTSRWLKRLGVVGDFGSLLSRRRRFMVLLYLLLGALAVELLIFAGISDIQFSFLRYKLGWGDKKYGWLSGLSYALSTLAVLVVYPFLRSRFSWSDGRLGMLGLGVKSLYLIAMAFLVDDFMAFALTALSSFNRFVSTALRSFTSSLVDVDEQGKIFSVVALLEGATSLLGTTLYNNVYPKTLDFFPGLMYLLSALLLVPPFFITWFADNRVKREGLLTPPVMEASPAGTPPPENYGATENIENL